MRRATTASWCGGTPVLNVCLATTMETAATMVRLGYAYGHYGRDRAGLFDSVLEQARAGGGRRLRLGVGAGPPHAGDRGRAGRRPDARVLHDAGRARRDHVEGPSRCVRRLPRVPRRRAVGEDPHHARRHLRRARRVRDRRRVVRDRAHGLRVRPRPPWRAVRAPRGDDRDRAVDVRERDDDLRREALSRRGRAELPAPGPDRVGCRS